MVHRPNVLPFGHGRHRSVTPLGRHDSSGGVSPRGGGRTSGGRNATSTGRSARAIARLVRARGCVARYVAMRAKWYYNAHARMGLQGVVVALTPSGGLELTSMAYRPLHGYRAWGVRAVYRPGRRRNLGEPSDPDLQTMIEEIP
jgi:hypothetical protein